MSFCGHPLIFAYLQKRGRLKELPDAIAAVAQRVADRSAFTALARDAAGRFGPSAVPVLRKRFHKTSPSPPEFDHPKAPLGAWLGAWHSAIFEILYHLREPALPLVRKVT